MGRLRATGCCHQHCFEIPFAGQQVVASTEGTSGCHRASLLHSGLLQGLHEAQACLCHLPEGSWVVCANSERKRHSQPFQKTPWPRDNLSYPLSSQILADIQRLALIAKLIDSVDSYRGRIEDKKVWSPNHVLPEEALREAIVYKGTLWPQASTLVDSLNPWGNEDRGNK